MSLGGRSLRQGQKDRKTRKGLCILGRELGKLERGQGEGRRRGLSSSSRMIRAPGQDAVLLLERWQLVLHRIESNISPIETRQEFETTSERQNQLRIKSVSAILQKLHLQRSALVPPLGPAFFSLHGLNEEPADVADVQQLLVRGLHFVLGQTV